MKHLIYLVLFSFFSLTACTSVAKKENSTEQSEEVSNTILPVTEFKQALEKQEYPQLIDVRRASEYASGTINGASNHDVLDGSFQKVMETLDKNKPVYIFCAAGGRSGKASALLQKNGFTQVIDLRGGYNAWSK